MKIEKLNLQTYRGLITTVLVCWLLIVFASDLLAVWITAKPFQSVYTHLANDVRSQVIIISSIISLPIFLLFLFHIRHIETDRSQLRATIRQDDLTGLLSREAFLDDAKAELTAMSASQSVEDAFLIVDADFFKRINDTHGHIAGDRALIAITNALKKGIRPSDRIGRLGGEEFAVHLKNVTPEQALDTAEKLRESVIDASPEANIPDLQLTVSIGAVFYTSKQEIVDLLIAADKLLYRAKDNGRDRVEFANIEMLKRAA